jgi:hypothetical protein
MTKSLGKRAFSDSLLVGTIDSKAAEKVAEV